MNDLTEVTIGSETRRLGNIRPMAKDTDHWRAKGVYGDFPNQPMLPRSQWRPYSMRKWVWDILDQDGVGACNAFCTVTTIHGTRARQGLKHRRISAGYLYGNINGQTDDGSALDDALKWMHDHGSPWETTVGMLEWRRRQWAPGAAEEAKQNLILEAYWCPTFDHLASAVLSGYFCNTGIWWGQNDGVDSNGFLNPSPRGQRGGHSIPAVGLFPYKGNLWAYETANSWGTNWGDNGYAKIPETRVSSDGMSSGMWAVCAVSVPEVPDDLPPLVATAGGQEADNAGRQTA